LTSFQSNELLYYIIICTFIKVLEDKTYKIKNCVCWQIYFMLHWLYLDVSSKKMKFSKRQRVIIIVYILSTLITSFHPISTRVIFPCSHVNLLQHPLLLLEQSCKTGGCRGRDHMVVGFTTTYAISAYHHWWDVLQIQHCLWLAAGLWFSPDTPVSSTSKLTTTI
jgi:hypothetical protein